MISAAGYGPQQSTMPPSPYGQQTGPTYQMPQQLLPVSTYQPTAPNLNIKTELDKSWTPWYLGGQLITSAAGMVFNYLNAGKNAELIAQAGTDQKEIAIKFYETQDHFADNQMTVAQDQLTTQRYAMDIQKQMHQEQGKIDIKLAKLESATQRAITNKIESEKTKRLERYVFTDTFNRRSWDFHGSPAVPEYGLS